MFFSILGFLMEMIPHLVIDIMNTIKLLLIHKQIFFLTFFHGHNIKITEFPLKYGRETQQKEKEKKMKENLEWKVCKQ